MKRFTETNKWRDPWFRKLSPIAKLLFQWMTDNCDNAGVLELDFDAAEFDIGTKITPGHLDELKTRLHTISSGKISLVKFIYFQYGNLSEKCVPHQKVIELLKSHGLTHTPPPAVFTPTVKDTLPPTLAGSNRIGRGEEEYRKGSEEEGGAGGRSEPHFPEANGKMTLKETKATASMIGLAEWRAVDWWNEMEGCGWRDHNQRPIHNGRSVLARVKAKWEADGRPNGPPKSKTAMSAANAAYRPPGNL